MKKIFNLLAIVAMASCVFAGCEPETPTPTPTPPANNETNDEGNEQTAELKADFTFAAEGTTVKFTNASTGATAYLWNFGDENTSTEENPEHTYDAAGTYTVKLTVQDAAGTAKSVEKEVSVAGAVKAYFSATAKTDRAGKFGKIFSFDATSSENAASIAWDFGDGSESSTEFKVDHEFPEYDKTYTVKATVTGLGGDVQTHEATVEVVGYNELIKGGSMEADDAQFWTVKEYFMMAEDWSGETTDPQFVHEFGAANGPAGGHGGALRIGGESQFMQYSFKSTVYQAIELVEGDQIELSAQIKWGEETVDNGVFFWCITPDATALGTDDTCVLEFFNYWSVVGEGAEATSTALPAYDGGLNASEALTDYGFAGHGGENSPIAITEDGKVIYTSTYTGTVYFGFEIRSVWGVYWGAGKDYWVDEVSAKILL